MIDIADFACGQSRMLYGKTMHSNVKITECMNNSTLLELPALLVLLISH